MEPTSTADRHDALVHPDGRTATLSRRGAELEVAAQWSLEAPEAWTQDVGSEATAVRLYEDYLQRLIRAGFRAAGSRGAGRLSPAAAMRVADVLRRGACGRADADLAALIEADVRDDGPAVDRACAKIEAAGRRLHTGIEPLNRALSKWGAFVWVFDDDHMGPSGENIEAVDPVVQQLQSCLRSAQQIHLQCFGPLEPFTQMLERGGMTSALTHLCWSPIGRNAAHSVPPPSGLLALCGAKEHLRPWLGRPQALPHIEALTIAGVDRVEDLDLLGELASLRHLGIWNMTPDVAQALPSLPWLDRLESLDVAGQWKRSDAPLVERCTERLVELPLLRRLLLPRRPGIECPAPPDPRIRWVDSSRLQALGHDIMRIGFPSGRRG